MVPKSMQIPRQPDQLTYKYIFINLLHFYKLIEIAFFSEPLASGCARHFFPVLDQTLSSQSNPEGHLRDFGAQKLSANLDHGGAISSSTGRTDAFTGGWIRPVWSTREQFHPASMISLGRNRDSAFGGIISRPPADIRKLPLGPR